MNAIEITLVTGNRSINNSYNTDKTIVKNSLLVRNIYLILELRKV